MTSKQLFKLVSEDGKEVVGKRHDAAMTYEQALAEQAKLRERGIIVKIVAR